MGNWALEWGDHSGDSVCNGGGTTVAGTHNQRWPLRSLIHNTQLVENESVKSESDQIINNYHCGPSKDEASSIPHMDFGFSFWTFYTASKSRILTENDEQTYFTRVIFTPNTFFLLCSEKEGEQIEEV